jgi:4-hydroxy-4-methyl-2-oxoglutarate aldolase
VPAHGVRGLVVDAGVRDVDELTQMRVGFGRRRSAQGTVKETLGNVQTPVIRAGVPVAPSDVIVADADGLWRCAGPPRGGAGRVLIPTTLPCKQAMAATEPRTSTS